MDLKHKPDPEKVRQMFSDIAGKYDLANTVLSAGVHHLWRKRVVDSMASLPSGAKLLDCATGTGDLAIEFKRSRPDLDIVGADFCREMLDLAKPKASQKSLSIKWMVADAMNLPFPDDSFDALTISFGLRNVASPDLALREFGRVLKNGGELAILEFGSDPSEKTSGNGLIKRFISFYNSRVLPVVGGLITGKQNAYTYLNESSRLFPAGDELMALIRRSAPFVDVRCEGLTHGTAFLYRARKHVNGD